MEGGCARACRPSLPVAPNTSPSHPIRARWRHVRAHPQPYPSPFAPYAWDGGTRGRHPQPPTLPHSRGRGGVHEGMPPPLPVTPSTSPPPLGHATPYARDGGTRGHATQRHPSPFTQKGVHEGTRPPSPSLPAPPPLATPPPSRVERQARPVQSPCAHVHRARTPFARHSMT
ncbi:hypothetical protein EDB85DRAFT_1927569 [Lactarius pseudohatsudake]|nr:hypothetical protein EDB85DRAFT_1927569 [Lactarius pseudohatsudake]